MKRIDVDRSGMMWKGERKEHPSFTNKQIDTIVRDHKKKGVRR
jgi:hypothetical protein